MSSADASALTPESTRAYRRHVEAAAEAIRDRVSPVPPRAILAPPKMQVRSDLVSVETSWPADDLPHVPTPEDGSPVLSIGTLAGRPVLVLEGGPTLDAGFTPREVVVPVRMLALAGVDTMMFATTSASLAPEIHPADLVLVTDHINFQGANPLVGPNVDAWGPRFPDMSEPYAPSLRRTADEAAAQRGLPLRQGVYFAALGPNRPTRAEARMARTMGGDLFGTHTVPEVIAARHMDVSVMALSAVTRHLLPGPDDEARAPADALASVRPALYRLLEAVFGEGTPEEKSV